MLAKSGTVISSSSQRKLIAEVSTPQESSYLRRVEVSLLWDVIIGVVVKG